ncbi:MAG: C39 family peptidase [Candidatus Riflebacteria bacterium]|nr:C39 family peptidase [Candidatus Riflebacteria bacterium]
MKKNKMLVDSFLFIIFAMCFLLCVTLSSGEEISATNPQNTLNEHDLGSSLKGTNTSINSPSSSEGSNPSTSNSSQTNVLPQKYVVVSGDTLKKIAKDYLGDESRYTEIVELNKSKYPSIEKNPNIIYPGWELPIPGDSTPSNQVAAADQSLTGAGNKIPSSANSSQAAGSSGVGTVHVNTSLNIRTSPWGKIIGSFHNGDQVQIIAKEGVWYKINWNGKTAYCHSNYITVNGNSSIPTTGSPTSGTTNPNPGSSSPPPGGIVSTNGGKVLQIPKLCQIYVKCAAPMAACGPTALAMILAYYTGQNVNTLASTLYNTCGCSSNGTSLDGLLKGARQYGFSGANWVYGQGLSWVQSQISAGKPILAFVSHHYVVIKGFDGNGNVILNDPGRGVVERSMPFSQFSSWWTGGGLQHAAMVLQ